MNLSLNKGQGSDAERVAAAYQAIALIDKHGLLRDEPLDARLQDIDEDVKKTLLKIQEMIKDRSRFDINQYTALHLSAILATSMQIREIVRGGFSRLTRLIEQRFPAP